MRILSIQPDGPLANKSGANIRNLAIMHALAEHGDVSLLCFDEPSPEDANPAFPVFRIGGRNSGSVYQGKRVHRPLSHIFSPQEHTQIAAIIGDIRPDIAIVEGVLLRDCITILTAAGIPVILDTHNVESTLWADTYRSQNRSLFSRGYLRGILQGVFAGFEEPDTIDSADHVWACSKQDAASLGKLSGQNIAVVPNPIPNPKLLDIHISADRYRQCNIVFVGHFQYPPNRQATEILVDKLVPFLPKAATITFAGREISDEQRREIEGVNGTVIPDPNDMFEILKNAHYTILPIYAGGGTRIKVLEALSAGIVIIATAKAVEGLGLIDGTHFVHAEKPAQMLKSLKHLASNPQKAESIARAGRQFVQEHHGKAAISNAVREALASLTS